MHVRKKQTNLCPQWQVVTTHHCHFIRQKAVVSLHRPTTANTYIMPKFNVFYRLSKEGFVVSPRIELGSNL